MDEDHGGSISKDELRKLMETLRLKPTEEELQAMMKEVDADGSGDIDFNGIRSRVKVGSPALFSQPLSLEFP